MDRNDLIKALGNKIILLRNPRNKQLKAANDSFKNEMKNLDETIEDLLEEEGIDIDIVNRSFFKQNKMSTSHIKDNYDDIYSDKLYRKSWKDKYKKKKQYK